MACSAGPVAGGQQLLVEIEEGHHPDRTAHLVEDGLGADDDPLGARAGRRPAGAGDLGHRLAEHRLELLPHPAHADPQVPHGGAPAVEADLRPLGAAMGTHEPAGLGQGDGRPAALAPGDLAAGHAGEQPAAAGAVEHAHDPAAVAFPQPGHESLGVQARPADVVAASVDDVEDRPARPLVGRRAPDERAPCPRLEARTG